MIKKISLAGLLALMMFPVHSQDDEAHMYTVVEDLIENIAREADEDVDFTTFFHDLIQYYENPLNLNTATIDELERLHLLNHFQVLSLQEYIKENGELLNINELPLVYGFDITLARSIEPFVTVIPSGQVREFGPPGRKKPQHDLFLRSVQTLQRQKGYKEVPDSVLDDNPNAVYPGSRIKFYTRYRLKYSDNVRIGFVTEKDAGEEMFGSNTYGFDYYSGYVQLRNLGAVKELMIGDFQARLGQGAVMWSGYSFSKHAEVLNIQRRNQGVDPYSSTNENSFLRGLGTTLGFGRIEATLFASSKKVDANITDTLADGSLAFSTFQTSGSHALPREVYDEDAIRESVIGGNISYNLDRAEFGFSALHYRYDGNLDPGDDPGDWNAFSGSRNTNFGMDYAVMLKKVRFSGEIAMSSNRSIAMINGGVADLASWLKISALHRYYMKDYHGLFADGFSEGSDTRNENGLYLGLLSQPFQHWTFSFYLDAFSFPWFENTTWLPVFGSDFFFQTGYQAEEGLYAYFRYTRLNKPKNDPDDDSALMGPDYKNLSRPRFHIRYAVSEQISFQNRLELSLYRFGDHPLEKGYTIIHDVLYRPIDSPLSFTLRLAVYDTDSWESRIYSYEHDLLYAFRVPSFHGQCFRTYLNMRYRINRHIDVWAKVANSYYPNRDMIGSGLNEIEGNNKTDLRVQVRLRF